MSDERSPSRREAKIAKLIAAAGPGAKAGPEARQRVYTAVRARWEAAVAERDGDRANRHVPGGRFGRRRRSWAIRTIGAAAAVAGVAVALFWLARTPDLAPVGIALARYNFVAGQTEIRRRNAASASTLAAEPAGAVLSGDTVVTGPDGRLELERPDGLLLRMNVASEIEFTRPDQIELVAGTIYIDSGDGGSNRKLEVTTPFGSVEHTGTRYEVRFADAGLRIRVRDGAVAFTGATQAVGLAGQQLNIDAGGSAVRSPIAPNDVGWDWAAALATLPARDDYELGETLAWIARELGLSLDYADPGLRRRLAGRTIVGLEGLNPREALAAIVQIADLKTEIIGNQLVVSE